MGTDAAEARAFLDRMIGGWELSGRMGSVPLHQAVDARWVLGGRFVQMSCTQTDTPEDARPYEALYHIGHEPTSGMLVMHLLDSTPVVLASPVGVGRVEGDSVDFVFEYESGPFHNRFTHDSGEDSWTHELVDMGSGEARPFATKRLRRRSLDRAENHGLLAYLRQRQGVDAIALRRPPPGTDRFALGTHPEVVEHLWQQLNAALPEHAAFLVGDGPALVEPHSAIVLALALGTQYALRLTDADRRAAVAAGAEVVHTFATSGGTLDLDASFGSGWVFGSWDEREGAWLAESAAAANL